MRTVLALALACTSASLVGCADVDTAGDPSVVTTDLNGDTWTTVDDLPYTSGQGAVYTGVAVAPNGKVYVVGARTEASGNASWLVRESGNGGAGFGFNSDFVYSDGTATAPGGIAIDSSGRIFISGWGLDASGTMHWLTRRSTDNGATWTTVDDWLPSNSQTFATSVAIDDADVIFVGGGATQNGDAVWKVRFSTDHGATWSQADVVDEGPLNGIGAGVAGVCFNGGNAVAVGYRPIAHDTPGWQVRSSSNGGPWTETENWVPVSGGARANGCGGFGGTSALYVAGQTMSTSFDAHWIVQRSANGAPLAIVDELSSGNDISAAFAVRAGDVGTIYAAGVVGTHWRVRKTTDGTTWVNSDDFSLADGPSDTAEAMALRYSPELGHTFVVGMATDSSGRRHGIVRRR
jgi:hypothetical protein